MENPISNTVPPVTNQPPQVPATPSTNWTKIVSLVVLALVLMGSSVFAGIQIGKSQSNISELPKITIVPTTQPTSPTLSSETPDTTYDDYSCSINTDNTAEIKNGVIISEDLRGCNVAVTYCKGDACTPPVEGIPCNQTRKICDQDIYCECPKLEKKGVWLRLYEDKTNFISGKGGDIVFVLENITDEPIYYLSQKCSHEPFLWIKQKDDWVPFASPTPYWCKPTDTPMGTKLEARSEVWINWESVKVWGESGMYCAPSGTYKIAVEYATNKVMENKKTLFSPEFEVVFSPN